MSATQDKLSKLAQVLAATEPKFAAMMANIRGAASPEKLLSVYLRDVNQIAMVVCYFLNNMQEVVLKNARKIDPTVKDLVDLPSHLWMVNVNDVITHIAQAAEFVAGSTAQIYGLDRDTSDDLCQATDQIQARLNSVEMNRMADEAMATLKTVYPDCYEEDTKDGESESC